MLRQLTLGIDLTCVMCQDLDEADDEGEEEAEVVEESTEQNIADKPEVVYDTFHLKVALKRQNFPTLLCCGIASVGLVC